MLAAHTIECLRPEFQWCSRLSAQLPYTTVGLLVLPKTERSFSLSTTATLGPVYLYETRPIIDPSHQDGDKGRLLVPVPISIMLNNDDHRVGFCLNQWLQPLRKPTDKQQCEQHEIMTFIIIIICRAPSLGQQRHHFASVDPVYERMDLSETRHCAKCVRDRPCVR